MFGDNGNLGAARKRGRKRSSKGTACRAGIVSFKTRRGKVVKFRGKTGAGCSPRKKPSTRHLAPYKRALAAAARACKGKSAKAFRACVRAKL
jgi:hypothetical protein